jgi:hypothetical protein
VIEKVEETPPVPDIDRQAHSVPRAGPVARGGARGRGQGRRTIDRRRGSVIARDDARKNRRDVRLPVIDLTTDLDLSGNLVIQEWWKKEKEAFKDAAVYDEVAGIQVSQVAVCLNCDTSYCLTI